MFPSLVAPAGGSHLRWAPRPRSLFLHLLLLPVLPKKLILGAGSCCREQALTPRVVQKASVGSTAPLKSNLAADSWHFSPNTVHLPLLLILIEKEFELQVDNRQTTGSRTGQGLGLWIREWGHLDPAPSAPSPAFKWCFPQKIL